MAICKTTVNVVNQSGKRACFDYNVNVSSKGVFSARISDELKSFLSARGESTEFASATTLEAVRSQVRERVEKAHASILLESELYLAYAIETICTYQIMDDGDFYPNGLFKGSKGDWKQGTKQVTFTNPSAYGFNVYCKPFIKNKWQHKDGSFSETYEYTLQDSQEDADQNLKWLCAIVGNKPTLSSDVKEIKYTSEVGIFFVSMFKSIFKLNERIKQFIEPEAIEIIAKQNYKLLEQGE